MGKGRGRGEDEIKNRGGKDKVRKKKGPEEEQ